MISQVQVNGFGLTYKTNGVLKNNFGEFVKKMRFNLGRNRKKKKRKHLDMRSITH